MSTSERQPIIWIIGATRTSKSNLAKGLAQGGRGGLNCGLISTSDYFRDRHNKPDTMSKEFVFDLSDFTAACLAQDPECNIRHLEDRIADLGQVCVIEGERNPFEFAKLYEPDKDIVFFLDRSDMQSYDTTIENGVHIIEQSIRWNVSNGITSPDRVTKFYFGDETLKVESFGTQYSPDQTIENIHVGPRTEELRYPWIAPMIQIAANIAMHQIGPHIKAKPSARSQFKM